MVSEGDAVLGTLSLIAESPFLLSETIGGILTYLTYKTTDGYNPVPPGMSENAPKPVGVYDQPTNMT